MKQQPDAIFDPPPSYCPGGPRRRGMWRVEYWTARGIVERWFKTKLAAQEHYTKLFLKGKQPEIWKESNT